MSEAIDLGSGYSYRLSGWSPDRELNPQYDGITDEPRFALILTCPHGDGSIHLDGETQRRVSPSSPKWTVESWDPLTLSPSLLRMECGCHGFIKAGRWVVP